MAIGLARSVGSEGRVYANEIDPNKVKALQTWAADLGLGNLGTHLSTADDPLLPPGRIEVAFTVEALHHLEQPAVFLVAVRTELAQDARVVIVEPDINQTGGELDGCCSDPAATAQLVREPGFTVTEVAEHQVEDTLFLVLTAKASQTT